MIVSEQNEQFEQFKNKINQLILEKEESDRKIEKLINYNTKLPNDINKYFKMLKNQLEDLQDQVDRIEEIVDVKITSKQEMNRLKLRVKNLEEDLTATKSKCLDIEDHQVGIEKCIFRNKTENDLQYQDLLSTIDLIQKPTNKKLQSDINNTKYSIKKLTFKKQDKTITEKEQKRLEYKINLLEELQKK